MTLTRNPCDLDTMSLFQDLKLKRRKVDSRCSSDGESVAETSTSSPDMAGPHSPCSKLRSPSPDPEHLRERTPDKESAKPLVDSRENQRHLGVKEEGDNCVFDGGGWKTFEHAKQDKLVKKENASEDKVTVPRSVGESYGFPVKHLKQESTAQTEHRSQTDLEDAREVRVKAEGDWDRWPKYPPVIVERRPSPVRLSPEHLQQRRPSPVRTLSDHLHQRRPSPARLSPEQLQQQRPSPVRLSPEHLHQQRASPLRLSPEQQQRLSPLFQRTGSIVHRPEPSGLIPPGTYWAAAGRINGVRPEMIGGDMKPPRAVAAPTSPCSRHTPTVIMGEAGGVRTMIWSQPSPVSPPASTSAVAWSSSSGGASSNSSEESAAQLLLNLGQPERQHFAQPLNMERLWAGDLTQLPPSQQHQALNLALAPAAWPRDGKLMTGDHRPDPEEDDQPMICMICEDKATGLHYGIITCEGKDASSGIGEGDGGHGLETLLPSVWLGCFRCKGFFKRTVQNRRVYTCVADGNCEITKAQRNRCQYCRFKKCIEQGMVLQAVREDRMPGGRNSGAVYNLYKVKYKKHKKTSKNGQVKGAIGEKGIQQKAPLSPDHAVPPHVVNGTILKTALTNPSEIVHLRHRLDNTVSSSRDRAFPLDTVVNMIQALIDCDEFQDIATLRNLDELLDHKSDLSEKLCQIGDSIVYKLVQWTKRLPFYLELPVEVHTRLLTHKWHELLVLTTSAYQAIHGVHKLSSTSSAGQEADFTQEVSNNLVTLQTCLTSMMGRPITMDQLRQDVGLMVEKITHVTLMFRRVKLRMEEYVCLKVITMLSQGRGGSTELEAIQDRYMTCLKNYLDHTCPQQPSRFQDLLLRLPEIQSAASLLLESKMFYVPFLLNSAIQR